jgi:ATP-dependent DNA ligase
MTAIEPALCRPTIEIPTGERWTAECKLDGFRAIFSTTREGIELRTRNGHRRDGRLPYIETELAALPPRCVLDGELVALVEDGAGNVRCDFDAVGPALASNPHLPSPARPALSFHAFDCLFFEGDDLRSRPWHERRAALEELLAAQMDHVAAVPTRSDTDAAHQRHLELGQEGTVFKRIDGPYRGGKRTWLKAKRRCESTIEIVAVVDKPGPPREVRVRCARRGGRGLRDVGWAEVWNPSLRRRLALDGDRLRGAPARVAYSNLTPRGRMREARLVALEPDA